MEATEPVHKRPKRLKSFGRSAPDATKRRITDKKLDNRKKNRSARKSRKINRR